MELFFKVYETQFSTTPKLQVFEILECEIEKNARDVSTATLIVPPYLVGIKQYNWIEIYEPFGDSADRLLFRGFIENRTPELTRIILNIKGEKSILKRKSVTVNQTFTGVSISSMLTSVLNGWNSAWGDNYSVSTSSTYNVSSKQIKQGDNIYAVIDEQVNAAKCVWDVVRWVVKIEPSLWNDYTTWSNLKEVIYDWNEAYLSNVTNIKLETFGSIANIIYGTDGTNNVIKSDAASIAKFWPLVESKSFRKTDVTGLNTETQSYLDTAKGEQFSYVIEVDANRFEADVGDKVILTIQNLSPDFDFSWYGFVNRKKMKLVNATMKIEYELSDKYFLRDDFYKKFRDLDAQVNLRTYQ